MSEWKAHDGGPMPVSSGTRVSIKLRGGMVIEDEYSAEKYRWTHNAPGFHCDGDIIAYRDDSRLCADNDPQDTSPKDAMQIYCDNFLALSKALGDTDEQRGYFQRNHEFLKTLAEKGIEISVVNSVEEY